MNTLKNSENLHFYQSIDYYYSARLQNHDNNNNNMNINTILNLTLNNYDGDCGSVWLMSWTRVVAGRAETNLKLKKIEIEIETNLKLFIDISNPELETT